MKSYWRERCKDIIAKVLSKGLDPKEERKAFIKAYPFGERKRWPYKVWLDEIKRQKGLKRSLYPERKKDQIDQDQLSLFNNA